MIQTNVSPTLDGLFQRVLARQPDAPALLDPLNKARITGRAPQRMTFAQADEAISALASHFIEAGLPANSVIGVQLPNTVEFMLTVLAAHRAGVAWRSICVLSDGEMDEGSNWEAIQFAQHFRLSNLIAIVDYNKIQSFGSVADISDLHPLAEKFRAFNWGVHELDGHDHEALTTALASSPPLAERPTAIIAHTIKGKGVSFMEGQLAWHYKNPDAAQLKTALAEIETGG